MPVTSIYQLFVPVWILYLQPIHPFFGNHVITPKPFPTNCTYEDSKKEEIWGSTSGLNGEWVRINLSFVTASCVLKLVSGWALSGWRMISSTFLWGWSQSEILLQDFKILIVQLTVWPHGIITLKQCLSNCSCWPARAMYVTELHLAFLRTCNSRSPTTNTAFINSNDIAYILNRLWMFVTDSFSTTRN